MKRNLLKFSGLQLDKNQLGSDYYKVLFINDFIEKFDSMKLKYEIDNDFKTLVEGDFKLNTILDILNSREYQNKNILFYLRSKNYYLELLRLGESKDKRDYERKYSKISIDIYFYESALREKQFSAIFDYYKPFFLRFTVPILYYLGSQINSETTNGKYTNAIMFRHLNDFPFTGISICWKMILGELYFDEDYTFEKIAQTPALYNTPLLKKVDGRDYNLIELHTYKDFYNYESEESMKSLRETYGY
ncbi:hypothetical protein, partial [Flammeovirga sp. SJP92]|uniref:hypothetical protein n=1 Tax=Flammeovirga sp. SJP92 TaxID=1775430 RepID=UPI0012F77D05